MLNNWAGKASPGHAARRPMADCPACGRRSVSADGRAIVASLRLSGQDRIAGRRGAPCTLTPAAGLPDLLVRRRHVHVGGGRNRIRDGIHDGGERGGGCRFAGALDAERIGGGGTITSPIRKAGMSVARGMQ